MKAQATLKNLRISPRKTRLVTRALVGASIQEALIQLSQQTKKASEPLKILLKSAVANATQNHGLEEEQLYIQDIQVGEGTKLKRYMPRAHGRATQILRRGSHVTVIVAERFTNKETPIEKKEQQEKTKTETVTSEKEQKPAPRKVAKKTAKSKEE